MHTSTYTGSTQSQNVLINSTFTIIIIIIIIIETQYKMKEWIIQSIRYMYN